MKQVEITWSHIMARKLSSLREEKDMSQQEIADHIGVSQNYVSSVLGRQKKGNQEFFMLLGESLGISRKDMQSMIIVSIAEAIEQEYPDGKKVLSNFYQK